MNLQKNQVGRKRIGFFSAKILLKLSIYVFYLKIVDKQASVKTESIAIYLDISTFPLMGETDIKQAISHKNVLNYKTTTYIPTSTSVK